MHRSAAPIASHEPPSAVPRGFATLRGTRLGAVLLAAAAGFALLAAFHQVVRGGMGQGETRRRDAAVLAEATWRCQSLRPTQRVRACLDGLARPAVLLPVAPRSDGAPTAAAPQSTSTDPRPAPPHGLPAVNP